MTGFIFSCMALGVLAAAPVGPLCILVFNRSARSGFLAGWLTGLGSSFADACYCALGLAGLLRSLGTHSVGLWWLYRVGGIALCAMGALLIMTAAPRAPQAQRVTGYTACFMQGFTLTILNPMAALFFMTAGMQLVALLSGGVSHHNIFIGAIAVFIGAGITVGGISLLGRVVGHALSRKRIEQMRLLSGGALVFIGLTLLSGLGRHGLAFLSQLSQLFS